MVDQVGAGPTGPAPVLPGALRTARLTLLPLRVEHAEEMAVVLADPALHAFTGDAPLPVAELRARYQRQVAGSPDPAEAWGNWVIRLDAEGALTGYVQATATADQAEIAWVVGTPWQRRGIAKEAAQGLVAALTGTVLAHIHPDHRASEEVAAAAGLAPTEQWQDGERRWELTLP